jgi:hypothetical protein
MAQWYAKQCDEGIGSRKIPKVGELKLGKMQCQLQLGNYNRKGSKKQQNHFAH